MPFQLFLQSRRQAGSHATRSWEGIQKIQHIVFLIKENRTFDHYFGTFPGADGATSGKISNGKTVPLTRSPDVGPYDLGHSWRDAIIAIDGGSMAKFDQLDSGYVDGYRYPYTQFLESDIPNYFAYARNFVLADRMFSSLAGPSFPNHLYTVAAQAGGVIDDPHASRGNWGCDSDENQTVIVVGKDGSITTEPPCLDFQTLADSLEDAHIPWKYYAPSKGNMATSSRRWMRFDTFATPRCGSNAWCRIRSSRVMLRADACRQ